MGRVSGRAPRRVQTTRHSGTILSRDRARKLSKRMGGGTLRSAWQIKWTVHRDLAYDFDMRKIVDHISVRLMEFYRAQVKMGKTGGGRALPKTKLATRQKFGGGTTYGLRSGYMADHWWRGKIRGSSIRSSVLVKPYGGSGGPRPKHAPPGGRAFMISNALRRNPPVDFQSVRGPARKVIQDAVDEAVAAGIGLVTNDPRPRTRSGLLPELR